MTWDELVAEFRALGGTVDNVRLGDGPLGRGIFAIDPAKPARLIAPPNLFFAVEGLELRGDRMLYVRSDRSERERAFFDAYMHYFAWGAGLRDYLWNAQDAWHSLPPDVITCIQTIGGLRTGEPRFAAPSEEVCHYYFVRSRCFDHDAGTYIVPLVELVNHNGRAEGYSTQGGIGVVGTFVNEMLVRYTVCDAWALAMSYGFTDPSYFAYSVGISVELFGRFQLTIDRTFDSATIEHGARFPKVERLPNGLRFPHLLLGNFAAMDTPRGIFRKIMSEAITQTQADDTFDSVAHFNRSKFIQLLRTLRPYDGPMIRMLADAAVNQLDALSACVGARAL